MHRAIAAWLTAHPWRAVWVTAALGVLSPAGISPFTVFAAAVPVLIGLERGQRWMFAAAAAGTMTAVWTIGSMGQPLAVNLVNIGIVFFGPAVLAALLATTSSLNLCFQLAVLASALSLIAVHVALEDPVGFWVPMFHSVMDSLTKAGFKLQDDPETVTAALAKIMWGALAALTVCTVLSALWLGRWWQSLLHSPGSFGREYQGLRVGTILGLGASLVLLLALWSDSDLVGSLVWIAFAALSLQGLAAAHRSRARGSLNRGWLAAIYVLLIVPLSTAVTVLALAAWGFADNWTRRRANSVST
ncbi:MAG TPA: hypothetical protein VJS42_03450 [Steroidobacteraceae bacterium]|nr:hypothetical protein [Steroidobacteraceae bacterium]